MTTLIIRMIRTGLILVSVLGIQGNAADLSAVKPETVQSGGDPHAGHRDMLKKSTRYQRSNHAYSVPEVHLINMSGESVSLQSTLDREKPVILTFIFTSCTTICPILTATLAQADTELRKQPTAPRIVAVSIDPEYDTPQRLRDYSKSYRAGPEWDFMTGDTESIVAVQRAFDVYRGNKMNHMPVTLLKGSGDQWLRLEGFTTAADLVREYKKIAPNSPLDHKATSAKEDS